MAMAVPEAVDVGDCEQCHRTKVERVRRVRAIEVRDWSVERRFKVVHLREWVCLDCAKSAIDNDNK